MNKAVNYLSQNAVKPWLVETRSCQLRDETTRIPPKRQILAESVKHVDRRPLLMGIFPKLFPNDKHRRESCKLEARRTYGNVPFVASKHSLNPDVMAKCPNDTLGSGVGTEENDKKTLIESGVCIFEHFQSSRRSHH